MKDRVRVTVVALVPAGTDMEKMHDFLERLSTREGASSQVTVLKTPVMPDGSRRLFAKISRVLTAEESTRRWHLRLTDDFYGAGFEEVAWRITKVPPLDFDPEHTTSTILPELFRDCLPSGIEGRLVVEKPPFPFGSDAFWEWVEEGASPGS